ncbi:MAG TPA: hypothetical protein VG897_03765 [Terriglobales bacterium]|nr:hypothetical protein [Terriglobales bacterium]
MGLFGKKQFQTVEGAMEFLVDRLAVEAEMQGYPLNEHERKALRYAADEPSTEWGIDWEKVRGSDNEGTEFESKMTELLRTAYKRDKDAGENVSRYKSAVQMIQEESYWIVAISSKAVPHSLF